MDSIEKINAVCESVLKLTPEDFEACNKMAQEQSDWVHPLKHARQAYFNEMGNRNQKILSALEALQIAIKDNAPK